MRINKELEKIIGLLEQDSDISNNLLQAKEFFFEACGKMRAIDVNYQDRINCFLNWFLFDWKLKDGSTVFKTIVSRFGEQQLDPYHYQFDKNTHSIFRFLKEKKSGYLIYDLFDKKKKLIEKEDSFFGISRKACFETRIFSINQKFFFSNYFIIHPLEANSYIEKSVKNLKKNQALLSELIFKLHKHYYKCYTYKHFTVQKIYCE
jgi:hypothetical protein